MTAQETLSGGQRRLGVVGVPRQVMWRWVRIALVVAYVIGYAWWFRTHGIILDRISVLTSMLLLLVVASVGRPSEHWARMGTDFGLYALMWLVYDETRGAADRLGMPLQVESVRNMDRVLFAGHDAGAWLQRHLYVADDVQWYDIVGSVSYYTHFVVPVAVIAIMWGWWREQWVRFIRRFATVLVVACTMFVLLPTAPPWMAAGGSGRIPLDAVPPVVRPTPRGWRELGMNSFVHAWEHGRDWSNQVAAMPSLHAAYALIIVVFFWPFIRRRWVRCALLAHPLIMAWALVYFAEHYVVDILAGWALVGLAFLLWNRIERRLEERRAARAADEDGVSGPGTDERGPESNGDSCGTVHEHEDAPMATVRGEPAR